VAQGALVSELPPAVGPEVWHFPERNRIISGLSHGVLVVEAAEHSGSLITARLAAEQGREVFAIPGSINNPMARGCHQLIRDGARLVETAEEIVTELSPFAAAAGDRLRARLQSSGADARAEPALAPQRDGDYARLLEALGHEPQGLDALAERTGLAVTSLSSMLLVLELDGEVQAERGGRYARVERP
jgi:DNA processing protein